MRLDATRRARRRQPGAGPEDNALSWCLDVGLERASRGELVWARARLGCWRARGCGSRRGREGCRPPVCCKGREFHETGLYWRWAEPLCWERRAGPPSLTNRVARKPKVGEGEVRSLVLRACGGVLPGLHIVWFLPWALLGPSWALLGPFLPSACCSQAVFCWAGRGDRGRGACKTTQAGSFAIGIVAVVLTGVGGRAASEGEAAVAADEVVHLGLDRLEAHELARLALKVVHNAGKRLELAGAAAVGAVVQHLLVCDMSWVCTTAADGGSRMDDARCWLRPVSWRKARWQR